MSASKQDATVIHLRISKNLDQRIAWIGEQSSRKKSDVMRFLLEMAVQQVRTLHALERVR